MSVNYEYKAPGDQGKLKACLDGNKLSVSCGLMETWNIVPKAPGNQVIWQSRNRLNGKP